MRIIGGRLKGKTILPPQGYKARPTTDFAKEGLFNILNNEYEMEGLQVLDLFGGTGAISYEFASRGASMVYCVEMLPLHANFIKSQAARFGMRNLTVVRHNVFEFLEICREKFGGSCYNSGQGVCEGYTSSRCILHSRTSGRI